MSVWLLAATSAAYFWTAWEQLQNNPPMAAVFLCYGLANIGLIYALPSNG